MLSTVGLRPHVTSQMSELLKVSSKQYFPSKRLRWFHLNGRSWSEEVKWSTISLPSKVQMSMRFVGQNFLFCSINRLAAAQGYLVVPDSWWVTDASVLPTPWCLRLMIFQSHRPIFSRSPFSLPEEAFSLLILLHFYFERILNEYLWLISEYCVVRILEWRICSFTSRDRISWSSNHIIWIWFWN